MTISLYDVTIPVLIRGLRNTHALVQKVSPDQRPSPPHHQTLISSFQPTNQTTPSSKTEPQASTWCQDNNRPETDILDARLAPDMRTFAFQIRACCVLSRSSTLTDAWRWWPSTTALDDESSLAGLAAALREHIGLLEGVGREEVEGREGVGRHLWTGGEEGVGFEAKFDDSIKFLNQFGLPNFWFHNTTAYALCRMKGVPLGKYDFLAGGGALE
ncbi:uncharacterized protein BKCO1_3000219 [Diplodia corticola]|uniref:Uncharacterized protein n=1 Tax=Diplodia corticola TaxID=236234 RepID=A0A1J9SHH9_9PEZI|nr:uncharacterized protein BKCO1_3000219 [Diplodia corticola]OJD39045.1 hypothetical protein BKCO1_3000219 [Diplodia corticola]